MSAQDDGPEHRCHEYDLGGGATARIQHSEDFPDEARDALVDIMRAAYRKLAGDPKPPDGEHCQKCGRQYLTVWWAGDRDGGALWERVYEKATGQQNGGAGLLCPVCFDDAARQLGITLHWMAMPHWVNATELERARELLGKFALHVVEFEGTDFLDAPSDHLTDDERAEIGKYVDAVRNT